MTISICKMVSLTHVLNCFSMYVQSAPSVACPFWTSMRTPNNQTCLTRPLVWVPPTFLLNRCPQAQTRRFAFLNIPIAEEPRSAIPWPVMQNYRIADLSTPSGTRRVKKPPYYQLAENPSLEKRCKFAFI